MQRLIPRRRGLRILSLSLVGLALTALVFDLLFPPPLDRSWSQIVCDRDGKVMHAFLSRDEKWRMYARLDQISPDIKQAILFKEDKYFYVHPGFNPVAMTRALFNNLVQGHTTSGASTITMQLARLLEPKPRTYGNKLLEVLRAVQLEWRLSKDEIFEMYLNLLPYGGNIEGVRAAALLYYGREADHLSLAQSVSLIVIPNRPTSLRVGRADAAIRQARDEWLNRLYEDETFDSTRIDAALDEPLDMARRDAPHGLPQLAIKLAAASPEAPVVVSSIDATKQQLVETISYRYLQRQKAYGVFNAAAMVIDNPTRQVLAYVGSADFNDAAHAGQVDGIRAVRSPGSTLKPLVYGLAFDRGLLTSRTIINDVPVDFAGYAPVNFDRKFNGPVTVSEALSHSLNIPAVRTLDRMGLEHLLDALIDAQFAHIRTSRSDLGLSTVLGGCGVTMEEMGGLYCALANSGGYAPLNYTAGDSSATAQPLISSSAAYMLTDILTKLERPDLPRSVDNSVHVPKVAWKTGTSYGRRDAWSIGFNKKFTIVVWLGNFSGEGAPRLTGADVATPLLFDLFNRLDYNSPNDWFAPPQAMDYRIVCTASGQPPSAFCTDLDLDYFLPGVSDNRLCEHMQTVRIAADESCSYCPTCLPPNGYKKKLFPRLEASLAAFYEHEMINYERPPPHNADCTRVFSEGAPRILSPVHGSEYLIEQSAGAQLKLTCLAQLDVDNVYWFLNDTLLGKHAPDEGLFVTPPAGLNKISCSDDRGRNTDIFVTVKYY